MERVRKKIQICATEERPSYWHEKVPLPQLNTSTYMYRKLIFFDYTSSAMVFPSSDMYHPKKRKIKLGGKVVCRLRGRSPKNYTKHIMLNGRGHLLVCGHWSNSPRNRFLLGVILWGGNVAVSSQFIIIFFEYSIQSEWYILKESQINGDGSTDLWLYMPTKVNYCELSAVFTHVQKTSM